MKISYFDPKERAREKQASRDKDDEDLRSGKITREELNRRNGGYGLMRGAELVLRKKNKGEGDAE